jgi:cytochrome c-type biogenesis protein CcmH
MSRGVLGILALAVTAVVVSMTAAAWLSGRPGGTAETENVPAAAATEAPPNREQILTRVSALRQRVAADPDDVEGWKMLGRSYMALERYRQAVEAWSLVKERRPRDPQAAAALEELAEIARRRGVHKDPKP